MHAWGCGWGGGEGGGVGVCATEQKLDFRDDIMCRHEAKFQCVILAWTVNSLMSVSLPCLINTSQGAFLCLTFYRELQH